MMTRWIRNYLPCTRYRDMDHSHVDLKMAEVDAMLEDQDIRLTLTPHLVTDNMTAAERLIRSITKERK